MEKLINNYEVKIVEAGCAPGAGRYGLQLDVADDISPVFPYFNALLNETRYDHQNCILIWREKEYTYALRPHRIEIAQIGGLDDLTALSIIASEIVARINHVWQTRAQITPFFREKARASVIDIFRLLPKTNCKQCGYVTCLTYAADLREGKITIEKCPQLSQTESAATRQKLAALLK